MVSRWGERKAMDSEKDVSDYYERYWPKFVQYLKVDETLGIHLGYYEKGIKTFKEAVLNMNDFVGRLLNLEDDKAMDILDAGCGVGGTSIYLAKKHPNIRFMGITITPRQVELAKKFAQERNVNNVKFMLGSYANMEFSDNYFDGVFALESINYTQNKKDILHEMYRILKPGGRLVVVDGFRTDVPFNFFTQKIYDSWCKVRGNPYLISINMFRSHLETVGFKEITIKNLAKNVSRTMIKPFIIGIPFFFSSIFKRIIKRRNYDPTKDVDYFLGATVLSCVLGLCKFTGYNAIISVKK